MEHSQLAVCLTRAHIPSLVINRVALLGSDGTLHIWDKDSRIRLKSCTFYSRAVIHILRLLVLLPVDSVGGSISAMEFNRTGTMLAYAISYDWSKGHTGMAPGHPNRLMLHSCQDDEVKKRVRR